MTIIMARVYVWPVMETDVIVLSETERIKGSTDPSLFSSSRDVKLNLMIYCANNPEFKKLLLD